MAADPRTLVIVAHPSLSGTSRVNRRWARELAAHPDEFVVRDLYALYPDGTLGEKDVEVEREVLAAHDTIVFQFPVYWYSAPAPLRTKGLCKRRAVWYTGKKTNCAAFWRRDRRF